MAKPFSCSPIIHSDSTSRCLTGFCRYPVVARSADGVEERSGTLSFRRDTKRVGKSATVAAKHLEPFYWPPFGLRPVDGGRTE